MARGILLPYGNRRRNAINQVNVGFLNALQKLPRIRRKRLHIAPLAFGINGVKGQGTLAAAGNPRHHRELVVRYIKINVLEIVYPRPADYDAFAFSPLRIFKRLFIYSRFVPIVALPRASVSPW